MLAPSSLAWKLTLLFGMLGTGAVNTLSKKIQNQSASVGIDGKTEAFSKPWSQTLVMFSGEACLIFVFFIQEFLKRRNLLRRQPAGIASLNSVEDETRQPLLAGKPGNENDENVKENPTWKTYSSPSISIVCGLPPAHTSTDTAS